MQITNRRSTKILACRRLLVFAAVLALVCGFAQIAHAQNGVNPLNLFKNYFVTGDYVVGGVGLRGLGVGGWATGTISIPDPMQPNSVSVPAGAEVVAGFLYWQTVESSSSVFAGRNGFFNGYAISGKVLGNPVHWGEGGCSGEPDGTKTLRTYRADVRPYLPLDANGKVNANGHFQVKLADSGFYGLNTPSTLGASVVIIYRLLASGSPLNAIILLDGTFAASTPTLTTTQNIPGFYQAASPIPVAEITQIVGNGRPGRTQTVSVNGGNLPSLYPANPPFPGIYNHSWDNPTWKSGLAVNANDSSATTSIVPAPEPFGEDDNGCVTLGATVFSTTVQDTDHDGLLDVWEINQGYVDVNTGEWVALPGANPNTRDIFLQVDYLNALGSASPHSHLPQRATLDAVASAYAANGINVHFDVGPAPGPAFVGDPYVIPYPLPVGPGALPPPAGTGGHGITESTIVCPQPPALAASCEFPGQPAISWKTGFENVKSQNFWSGRKDSYRYVLFGHSLGMPTSTWSATGEVVPNTLNGTLVSIVDVGATATVTIKNPSGDPTPTTGAPVTVVGAINQFALNGTYIATSSSVVSVAGGITITTFTIATAGVTSGTYNFLNEPQLAVAIGGPNSTSGFSDYGGADTLITLGLWPNSDPANCQHDPSQPPLAGGYCADQVGTSAVQTGTLLHEMGHPLTLTHGGTYYPGNTGQGGQQINNPVSVPTYGENCKSNYLSAMNYLFQIFGFPDNKPIDYSGQTLADLSESSLTETNGLGFDIFNHASPAHLTRWYAPPDAADMALQAASHGHHYAAAHCDGSPKLPGEQMVKIDNSATLGPAIDWNHNGVIDAGLVSQDINFNGVTDDTLHPFHGFNDWVNLNLAQIGARRNVAGFSGGVTGADIFGGGADIFGGGADIFGGGADIFGGGADIFGGGADVFGGGAGFEVDFTAASSTLDPASGLNCTDCVLVVQSGLLTEQNALSVPITWTQPGFTGGGITQFTVWRAAGNFPTPAAVTANIASFTTTFPITGAPALTAFIDNTVVNGTIYTYFVTGTNASNTQSGPSFPLVVAVLVPPSGLNCTNCVNVSGVLTERASLSVPLAWTLPGPGITSQNGVWRAEGSFPTLAMVLSNLASFTQVGSASGSPTAASFADNTVFNGKTYTYFVTDSTSTGVQSSPSGPVVVTVLVPPTGLHCTNCVLVKGVLKEKAGRSVPLAWTLPNPGITSQNAIWRATGSFPTPALVLANITSFTQVGTATGIPPGATFVDGTVANKTTYTYFVTDSSSGGIMSAPSNPIVVTVRACDDQVDDCEDSEELLLVLNSPTALEQSIRAAWLINSNESTRRFPGLDLRP